MQRTGRRSPRPRRQLAASRPSLSPRCVCRCACLRARARHFFGDLARSAIHGTTFTTVTKSKNSRHGLSPFTRQCIRRNAVKVRQRWAVTRGPVFSNHKDLKIEINDYYMVPPARGPRATDPCGHVCSDRAQNVRRVRSRKISAQLFEHKGPGAGCNRAQHADVRGENRHSGRRAPRLRRRAGALVCRRHGLVE